MYTNLVKEEMPQTKMVVDKFHIIRDANLRIDGVRRIEQNAKGKEIKRKIFLKNKEHLSKGEVG